MIGNSLYDESNPTGVDTLTSSLGCDSIVTTNLIFTGAKFGEFTESRCSGDDFSITLGETTFDESNPSGVDTIMATDGTDSIITVLLTFLDATTNTVEQTFSLGSGESLEINGTVYDEDNPTGRDTLVGANSNGCDSIIIVNLTFSEAIITTNEETRCSGDPFSLTVGTSVYDESNPSGTDTLMTQDGLDSIVVTELSFVDAVSGMVTETRCSGDGFELVIGNTIFDESNPTGQDTLFGMSSAGCDSIVIVDLMFMGAIMMDNPISLCPGETRTIGNTTYSEDLLSGVDTIMSPSGCDTIIMTTVAIDSIQVDICTKPDCNSDSNGSVSIFNLDPTMPLQAMVDGVPFDFTDSLVISDLAAGDITIDIFRGTECSITEMATIGEGSNETLTIEPSDGSGDSTLLDISFSGVIVDVMWASVAPTMPDTYTVTVTDDQGCTHTASIEFRDDTTPPPPPQDLPNFFVSTVISGSAIDPNNRLFFLQTADTDIVSYDLRIFNRFGNLVFDQQNLVPNEASQGWNGTHRSSAVGSGIFVYELRILTQDGFVSIDYGDVLIID